MCVCVCVCVCVTRTIANLYTASRVGHVQWGSGRIKQPPAQYRCRLADSAAAYSGHLTHQVMGTCGCTITVDRSTTTLCRLQCYLAEASAGTSSVRLICFILPHCSTTCASRALHAHVCVCVYQFQVCVCVCVCVCVIFCETVFCLLFLPHRTQFISLWVDGSCRLHPMGHTMMTGMSPLQAPPRPAHHPASWCGCSSPLSMGIVILPYPAPSSCMTRLQDLVAVRSWLRHPQAMCSLGHRHQQFACASATTRAATIKATPAHTSAFAADAGLHHCWLISLQVPAAPAAAPGQCTSYHPTSPSSCVVQTIQHVTVDA